MGEVRTIESLQWLEEYSDVGDVKLVCGKTQSNISIFNEGKYICNTQRSHLLAVIDSVSYTSEDSQAKITVRAKFSACVWDTRIMLAENFPTTQNAELAMLELAQNCKRGINCNIAEPLGFEVLADVAHKQGTVLTALKNIAATSGLGFRHEVDSALAETFKVYSGVDRTDKNSESYVGFFSLSAGNVKALTIDLSDDDYRNYAIVQSGDSGASKREVHVDNTQNGERREVLSVATDITIKHSESNGDGTFTEKSYTNAQIDALLTERGAEVLAASKKTFNVTATLQQTGILFGKHYEVGDVLPLFLGQPFNICVSAKVLQVKIIYETNITVNAVLEVSL